MELLIFLGSLFFFMCFGVPLAVVLVLCSIVLMFHSGMWDAMIIPNTMLDGTNNYPLMAIPFFVFAGEIMAAGGLSKRVVALAEVMVGRIRGGLGYAAIVASIIFAGLMGSSVGEAAALGGLLLPMMQQVGYDKGRAGAVIASGAILGPIIPPSTNFIILGATISGLSITKLFMIGLTPGIMIGLILMVVWWFIVRKDGYHDTQTFTAAQIWAIVKDSTPAFMMPVLLLGGIRFGVFTPTEGGAFAAIYAIILSFSPKFDALVNSIPAAIVGGVSFILYGMISAVGVRNIVENQVDLTKSRNLIIAAVMFVSGLGFSSVGGITFTVGGAAVTLSGLAIAALCGVILNAILPGNDYEFGVSVTGDKSADLGSY